MKRILIGLVAMVLVLGGVIAFRGEALTLSWMAIQTEKTDYEALKATLDDAIIVVEPDDTFAGPRPVLIQAHGCGGMQADRHRDWAAKAAALGFVSVIIDSNRPRGYTRETALETICVGDALLGQERAADLLVAYDTARATGRIDPQQVYLIGWSHGAWTIMDFLTMGPSTLPAGLTAYDGPWPEVAGAVLFYPHCGLGALSRVRKWQSQPNVLALLAAEDEIVDTAQCEAMLAEMAARGQPVEQYTYPGVNHGFDNAFMRAETADWYQPDEAEDAVRRVEAFLRAATAP